jgi:hypothetical protein
MLPSIPAVIASSSVWPLRRFVGGNDVWNILRAVKSKTNRFQPNRLRSLAIVAMVALAALAVCWISWYKPSEKHYRGRPSSWWARRIDEPIAERNRSEMERWLRSILGAIGEYMFEPDVSPKAIADDPAAVPMLVELLDNPDPRIWTKATWCLLWGNRKEMVLAIPLLSELLHHSQVVYRRKAASFLKSISMTYPQELRSALPSLSKALGDEDEYVRFAAGVAVASVAPELMGAGPAK